VKFRFKKKKRHESRRGTIWEDEGDHWEEEGWGTRI
jgi:hypothetical protein